MTNQTDYSIDELDIMLKSLNSASFQNQYTPSYILTPYKSSTNKEREESKKLRQRIIHNQKIVDTLIFHYKNGIKLERSGKALKSLERSYLIAVLTYIRDLLKSTGTDIEVLWK